MGHSLITAAVLEPVTMEQAKTHCRIDGSDEDEYVSDLIIAARKKIEDYLDLQMVTATWELTLDEFTDPIELPRWPLQSVTSIKYLDENAVEKTLAAANYEVVTNTYPGKVRLAYNKYWPTYLDHPDAVRIRYVAGYGMPASVDAKAKHAIKLLVGHWYEAREPIITGTIVAQVPDSYRSLLWSLRVR